MAIEHITITIETGNDAFAESPTAEIARILRDVADDFEKNGLPVPVLRDINGNFCGEVKIVVDESEEG
jgi:hypothetical protein